MQDPEQAALWYKSIMTRWLTVRADLPSGSYYEYRLEDLVNSIDTGEPPIGGVQSAHAGTELIFASIESHLRGGARVELPLQGSSVYLKRDRAPRQPRFRP